MRSFVHFAAWNREMERVVDLLDMHDVLLVQIQWMSNRRCSSVHAGGVCIRDRNAQFIAMRACSFHVHVCMDEAVAFYSKWHAPDVPFALPLLPCYHHVPSTLPICPTLSRRPTERIWIQKVLVASFVGKGSCEMMRLSVDRLLSRAESLGGQFDREGGRHLIDEAIALARKALEFCPPGHPMRVDSLTELSVHLSDRYAQFGDMRDIEDGILLDRQALGLRPPGHPDHHISLGNLGIRLATRYLQLGATDDLDKAIALEREGLVFCPPGHCERSILLNNLATCLYDRYLKLGAIEDLDESISFHRDSLALRPQGHPLRLSSLNNLARDLHSRYLKLGAIDNLDEAIMLNEESLSLCPLGHPLRSSSLYNLSVYLYDWYTRSGKIDDLNKVIELEEEALDLRPSGHPNRSSSLSNLSVRLYTRYKKVGKINDLNEAIVLVKEAFGLRPLGHPDRSTPLENLAGYLHARFTCLHQSQDEDELFSLYTQLADITHTASPADLSAAKRWISVAEDFKHSTTVLAYETYLRLLIHHLTALPSLPQHLSLVKDLTLSLVLDAVSAALRNQSVATAVEFLEHGRGIFLSQLSRLRSSVHDVITSGPEGKTLGERFLQLTSDIRKTLESSGANQHDRVCHLNIELQAVVLRIRKLLGFSHFLHPPLFSHLRKAAVDGPVVIVNASKYGCDAVVVFFDRDPIHIPLRITSNEVRAMTSELHRLTKQTKITDMGKYFAAVMRELWQRVVSPIVDVLKTNHPVQSRIWWCPTAEFSALPLHAAGMYRKGEPRFSDFYISSYTSTLTALIRARQNPPSNSGAEGRGFIGIGQAKATGESELHSIGDELTNIGERVGGHVMFTRMDGSESSVEAVMEALGHNEWVHLACHGLPNRKQPFESAFGLYDGKLTVERLLHCDLRNAEFAYLSACRTTVGDEDCLDEIIHLASAMQFAGFRSVIGTMWAVDDEQTVKITSNFYEKMVDELGRLDHTRAAYALHHTTRELQGLSFDQRILYVHFGA